MIMRYCVYALIDPGDGCVFYVGQTGNVGRRLAEHAAGTDQVSGLRVREIARRGDRVHLVILEHCRNETQSLSAEVFWIETMMARGATLLNAQATGGYVGRKRLRERQGRMAAFNAAAGARSTTTRRSSGKGPAAKRLRNIANGRPARGWKPWTKRDAARFKGMLKAGMSAEAIADALERTLTEITERLAKQG